MTWKKGESGNPTGNKPGAALREKPYREALRMELAAAGANLKALREIAAAHIQKAKEGDIQAIKELGDRIDGKVDTNVNIYDNRDISEWSRSDLESAIAATTSALAGKATPASGNGKPRQIH